jgi:glycosyltransferase involved in cell wall biosynthesis
MPELSICITFKNRAVLLEACLKRMQEQRFDLKRVEICLADGGSSDGWVEVVKRWYSKFHSIKTALCDRSKLPFEVASNCPATDRNAMVCNMASAEKVVVMDPEIRFTHANHLSYVSSQLKDKALMLHHHCFLLGENDPLVYKPGRMSSRAIHFGGYCLAFNKTAFVENGGFDERYALGFAGEDSYFVWWWKNNRVARQGAYPVMHLWHPNPSDNKTYQQLRREYTLPLHERLKAENAFPNKGQDWARPETIGSLFVWQV